MLVCLSTAARIRERRRERDARRGRLGPGRYDAMVRELARVIRLAFEAGATGSPWGLEGPLSAGIRADLCMQGWRWAAADALARELLTDAFRAVGATRPCWHEGQPEWVIEAGTLIERTRCAQCGKPLPDGHHKFCSGLCASRRNGYISAMKEANEDLAVWLATRSIRST